MRRHIILKVIILPRQARDKHRESSAQKQTCDFCFLSAGGEIVVKHELMTICIDEWIEFRSPGKVAVLIKQLRAVSHEREREREMTPRQSGCCHSVAGSILTIVSLNAFLVCQCHG